MIKNKTYKDFLGNEVKVGDIVITTELRYRNFIKCEVMKITNRMVFITRLDAEGYKAREFKQFHDQTIKI